MLRLQPPPPPGAASPPPPPPPGAGVAPPPPAAASAAAVATGAPPPLIRVELPECPVCLEPYAESPAPRMPRWTYARRIGKALELLLDPRCDALISGETAFSDLPKAYAGILAAPETLCHRIRY